MKSCPIYDTYEASSLCNTQLTSNVSVQLSYFLPPGDLYGRGLKINFLFIHTWVNCELII